MPKLRELKLNGSSLGSLRDLGSGLRHLQVLWVAHCGLTALDGLGALSGLRELYASFNQIDDMQPLAGIWPYCLSANAPSEVNDMQLLAGPRSSGTQHIACGLTTGQAAMAGMPADCCVQ